MLAEIVAEAARRFGDDPVMVTPDGWAVSYAELDQLSDEVASALAARGVGKGDVVALVLPSTPEYVVAYVALAKLGAVTVGVNPRLAPAEQVAALDVVAPVAGAGHRRPGRGRAPRGRRRGGHDRRQRRRGCSPPCGAGPTATPPRPTSSSPTTTPWRSCSRRARRADPRVPCSRTGSCGPSPPTTWGRRPHDLGRRRAHAVEHPVRPRRLHDQAALVPAAGHHAAPARPVAGRRRARPDRRARA